MENIGINVRNLRKSKGWTQKDLADKMAKAESTIGMWEQGRRQIDNESLKILSDLFNVSIDYLLGISKQPDYSVKQSQLLNPKLDRIYFLISLLSETDLELIEDVIENLLNKEKVKYEELYKNKKIM